MDPAFDSLLRKSQEEKKVLQAKIHELLEKQQADGFVKDSVTGRKLLARAHRLQEENAKYFTDALSTPSVIATEKALAASQLELGRLRGDHAELLETYEVMDEYVKELEGDKEILQKQLEEAQIALGRSVQPTSAFAGSARGAQQPTATSAAAQFAQPSHFAASATARPPQLQRAAASAGADAIAAATAATAATHVSSLLRSLHARPPRLYSPLPAES